MDRTVSLDHVLRHVTIWTWLFSIPLLVPHGATTGLLCPVLGILPLTFSSLTGVVHVFFRSRAKSRVGNLFMDVYCAMFLFSILVPSWVFMSGYRGNHLAGAYGSIGMMINFAVHTYFAMCTITSDVTTRRTQCPHCHRVMLNRSSEHVSEASVHSSDSKKSSRTSAMTEAGPTDGDNVEAARPSQSCASLYTPQRESIDEEDAPLL